MTSGRGCDIAGVQGPPFSTRYPDLKAFACFRLKPGLRPWDLVLEANACASTPLAGVPASAGKLVGASAPALTREALFSCPTRFDRKERQLGSRKALWLSLRG